MKSIVTSILAAALLVASGTVAHAGEGGAAGSVAIKFSATGVVTGVSSSIAVGKNGAATTSRTDATDTFTSAIGGGGILSVTNANDTTAGYDLTSEDVAGLAAKQENSLTSTAKIDGKDGTVTIP